MQDLTLALVQTQLCWEDTEANLRMLEHKLQNLDTPADIIMLPETFTSGFSMKPEKVAQKMNGPAIKWMLKMAAAKNSVITGSMVIEENKKYYNRLIWAMPSGNMAYYDKHHLFSMDAEDKVFTPGEKRIITQVKGWKICPLICYDLRFPEWDRNVEDYDLLLFVANWPERRIMHWRKLIPARAIENQCYVAGVNCYGQDGNGVLYNGNSMIVNPMGETICEIVAVDTIAVQPLSYEAITLNRRYFPFLKDRDHFRIED